MKINYPSISQFQQFVELKDYRPATKKEYVRYVCKLTLSAQAFLHRFLQHVLPRGLQRVRYFGWLSPAAKARFDRIRALLDCQSSSTPDPRPSTVPMCPCCHKPMRLLGLLPRAPPNPR